MLCRRISASSLYAAGGTSVSSSPLPDVVGSCEQHLDHIVAESFLPPSGGLVEYRQERQQQQQEIELAMSMYSVRMILYRPFICDHSAFQKQPRPPPPSREQSHAQAGVTAARSMLRLLPDPDESGGDDQALSLFFPCWSLVHHLCQAGAVLALELSLDAVHMPSDRPELVRDLQRVCAHLATLSHDSSSARQARTVFGRFLDVFETT
jgi:hypothetical protein